MDTYTHRKDVFVPYGTYICPLELHTLYKSCRTPINCDKSKSTHDKSSCTYANTLDYHTTTHIPHI